MIAAFAGSGDDALGFALAGIEVVDGPHGLAEAAKRADIAVLFVAAEVAEKAERELAALRAKHVPVFVLERGPS